MWAEMCCVLRSIGGVGRDVLCTEVNRRVWAEMCCVLRSIQGVGRDVLCTEVNRGCGQRCAVY